MRMNCLFAPVWQVLQALVSLSKATANLLLLLAPTAFLRGRFEIACQAASSSSSALASFKSSVSKPSVNQP
jgi:hypothetical protein